MSVMTLSVVSCADKSDLTAGEGTSLELSSVTNEEARAVKSVISGASFSNGTSIGVFITGADGVSVYDSRQNCSNIKFSKESGSGKWTSGTQFLLSFNEGIVFAYYPYKSGNVDINSIPLASSLNGDDVMYAECVGGVSSSNPSVSLNMRHALARLSISFNVSKDYAGSGVLNSLSLFGEGVALSAEMDATDGSLSNIETTSSSHMLEFGSLSTSARDLTEELLIVPASSSSTPRKLAIRCTIDNQPYEVVLDNDKAVIIQSGVQSVITLSLGGSGLFVEGYSDDYSSIQNGQW